MKQIGRFIAMRVVGVYVQRERWLYFLLSLLACVSASALLYRFWLDNTELRPAAGGTYIEGSVGSLQPLNPWFAIQNDVNRDIVSLVFAGLLKYNPTTKKIESDLATYKISPDGKKYSLTLHDGLLWHDSTLAKPHPVTADDVLFTFKSIQDPNFPNALLRQNFRGVTIGKVDARTVTFDLEQPYNFFSSNLTIGLLPKDAFDGIPVAKFAKTTDFGFQPIGAGPYKFRTVIDTELSTEVTLERFDRPLEPVQRLERIVFRIFPDYQSLLSDLRTIDGIRLVPRTIDGKAVIPRNFVPHSYTLPQYTALFFNMQRSNLGDQKLRLGLQLGLNKQSIVGKVGESVVVDTPLLELALSDWHYKFDPEAARGALFASEWYFPEKVRLQRILEEREANNAGILHAPPIVYLDTGALLTITGSTLGKFSAKNKVNGVPLSQGTQSGTWMVRLPAGRGTGALVFGLNTIKLTSDKGAVIDTCFVRRVASLEEYERALAERRLVDMFLLSKKNLLPSDQKVASQDLTLDRGYLRARTQRDPVGIRVNDAGKQLSLTLVTSPSPPAYAQVAAQVQDAWRQLGVNVTIIIPATRQDFEARLLKRDYDILLFGQSLLDNLDSYAYWHTSGVQKLSENPANYRIDAYNLSQYSSFEADALLETIRSTSTDKERADALLKLREVLKRDTPAVFLYSPLYTFAHRQDIYGVTVSQLSLHSDRFLLLHTWYTREERAFLPGRSWWSLFRWVWKSL